MGQVINVYKVAVTKLDGKMLLERPRFRWENNVKMDLRSHSV